MKKRVLQREILMKLVLPIIFLTGGYFPAISQVADKTLQIEKVQTAAGTLVGKGRKVKLILSDLTELEGSVVALTRDSFAFKFKGLQGKKLTGMILYGDVLEIKSKDISISFIPPESLSQYGTWEEVLKSPYNTLLEVVLENGQMVAGRTGQIKPNELTLINDKNERLVLPRGQISFLYKVRIPYGKTRGGLSSGAKKGGEIGQVVGPVGSALGMMIGTGVGGISGAAKNGKKLRVLIYSK